jgi:HAMP domain-containing protein
MDVQKKITNLKLRVKLLLAFGSLLVLSSALVLCIWYTVLRIDYYRSVARQVDDLNIALLEASNSLQYFVFEGYKDQSFYTHRQTNVLENYEHHTVTAVSTLQDMLAVEFIPGAAISAVQTSIDQLRGDFRQLKELLHKRGFKDFGLEGTLREAIHQVENASFAYNKADMLTLRRHEKDFFLRKDLKYCNKFNQQVPVFMTGIESGTGDAKEAILKNVRQYQEAFNEVVAIETAIGLHESEGLKGAITQDLNELLLKVKVLKHVVNEKSTRFQHKALMAMAMIFIFQFLVGGTLAIIYADRVTRAVKELSGAMQALAQGMFPARLAVKSEEEIGKTKIAFNQLLERMCASQVFAEAIGSGDLHARYDERFREDVLGQALLKMQEKLVRANEEQERITWTSVGIAKLSDILKDTTLSLEQLGDCMLKQVVTYVNANQGVLFLYHAQKGAACLERLSSYAYGKKKFIGQQVAEGEGLVGQCVLEKSTMLLTEVPKNYIRITSGLGEAVPRALVLVPLVLHKKVYGVLELASFTVFEPYHVAFLEKIAENIAAVLANQQMHRETERLLDNARAQAQQLASQEEELRQHTEELRLIQEQMEREKRELLRELTTLRSKAGAAMVQYN